MEINEAIENRRSIRKFKQKEVGSKEIREILEAGQLAPSAGNLQARDFILVRREEGKSEISNAANQEFIKEASVIIIVCANKKRSAKKYGERGKELYCIQDADSATQNILLKIHSMGLGSCWIGAFDEEKIKKEFDLPKHIRPVTILPVGYPVEEPKKPLRKNLDELIHKEKW